MLSRFLRFPAAALLLLTPASEALADFTDATGTSGLWGGQPSWGAQAVDIDADGDLDLVNAHHYFSMYIFTNDGAGSFDTFGLPQIVVDIQDRHGYLWSDLDGDDLLDPVCSHGGSGGCGCADDGNELWKSLGGGTFQVVANAGGMKDANARGRAFSAADVDLDGDLDLYHAHAPLAAEPNSLWRNDGGMTFVDVAPAWGVDEGEGTVGGLFADYDDDGDPDLLVGGEEFARSTVLWRNDGGTFTDATSAAFGSLPIIAGADWGDYDNDEDLDLAICEGVEGVYDAWRVDGNEYWFFANHRMNDDGVDEFQCDTAGNPPSILQWKGAFVPDRVFLGASGVHPTQPVFTLTDAYVGMPTFTPGVDEGLYVWRESPGGTWHFHVSAPPGTAGNYSGRIYQLISNPGGQNLEQPTLVPVSARVFRNDGGVFAEVTSSLGFKDSVNPRSVAWVDFDDDGYLDLHQVNKGTTGTGNEADILWRNDGSVFAALSGASWVEGDSDHLADGGVWGDLDEDGDLDLFLQEGAPPYFFANLAPSTFYRNDGPTGNWLEVNVGRTVTGGTPVGSKVTAWAGGLAVHRRVRADSWRGFQPPLGLHFGLGAAAAVDSLVITWPDGFRLVQTSVPMNTSMTISQNDVVSAPLGTSLDLRVGRLVPQPARGMQSIELDLPVPTVLRVSVYDIRGRRVRTLADGRQTAGLTRLRWDGRDEAGRPVAAGVYFLRGEGAVRFERKAVRLR